MKSLLITLILIFLTGCAGSDLRPSDIKRSETRRFHSIEEGVVVDVLKATIQGNTEAAQAIGAASGGYIANRAAKEKDAGVQAAATVAGAIVGSVAGEVAGNVGMNKSGITVVVRLSNGQIKAVTQQEDRTVNLVPGDNVWILTTPNGVRVYERS